MSSASAHRRIARAFVDAIDTHGQCSWFPVLVLASMSLAARQTIEPQDVRLPELLNLEMTKDWVDVSLEHPSIIVQRMRIVVWIELSIGTHSSATSAKVGDSLKARFTPAGSLP
jgi:hypothetical protein